MERNNRSLAQKHSSLNPAPDTEGSAAGACCRLAESRSRAASESSAAPVGVSQCARSVANSRGWQDRMSHVSTLPSECATMLMLPCGSECVCFQLSQCQSCVCVGGDAGEDVPCEHAVQRLRHNANGDQQREKLVLRSVQRLVARWERFRPHAGQKRDIRHHAANANLSRVLIDNSTTI